MKKLKKLKNTSVRTRTNGLIELRFYHNKEQKSVYGFTEKEVLEKYQSWKPTKKEIIKTEQRTAYFEEEFLKWTEMFRKGKIKEKTYKDEYSAFNKYVLAKLKQKKMPYVSTEDIQTILNSTNHIKRRQTTLYNLLNQFFKYCTKTKKIKTNPMDAVEFKRTNYIEESVALTRQEEEKIVELWLKEKTRIHLAFLILLSTGMRPNEIIKINGIEDVDRENNTLHIKGTKTNNSDAVIEFKQQIIDMIPNEQKPFNFSVGYLSHKFKSEIEKLKINKDVSLKSLRTTFATRCRQAGISEEVIAYILRHTNTTTTKKYYIKTQKDFVLQNIDKNPFTFKV